jgi:hypothetical protein
MYDNPPTIQFRGMLHHGTARMYTAIGMTIMLLVKSSSPWRTILYGHQSISIAHALKRQTDITSPTGKTNPPSIFTKPGLVPFRPGEPPDMISESRPPNESMTPARTCITGPSKSATHVHQCIEPCLTALKNTRSTLVRCLATPEATIAEATCAGRSVFGVSIVFVVVPTSVKRG